MPGFHDLHVWQRARELVSAVYRYTEAFPEGERFGLTAQMKRAAVSVPSNIAEGSARVTAREFARFLEVARSSACELESDLMITGDLGFGDPTQRQELIDEVREIQRMLQAMWRRNKNR